MFSLGIAMSPGPRINSQYLDVIKSQFLTDNREKMCLLQKKIVYFDKVLRLKTLMIEDG